LSGEREGKIGVRGKWRWVEREREEEEGEMKKQGEKLRGKKLGRGHGRASRHGDPMPNFCTLL